MNQRKTQYKSVKNDSWRFWGDMYANEFKNFTLKQIE